MKHEDLLAGNAAAVFGVIGSLRVRQSSLTLLHLALRASSAARRLS
jgi:hypothetical protein